MRKITQNTTTNARGFPKLRRKQDTLDDAVSIAFEMSAITEIVADLLFKPGECDMGEEQARICARSLEAVSRLAHIQVEQIKIFDTAMSVKLGSPLVADPLVQAIEAYRSGMARFNSISEASHAMLGGEERVIADTYGRPMERLAAWSQPATSLDGAIAALRMAQDELEGGWGNPVVPAMISAALGYLES